MTDPTGKGFLSRWAARKAEAQAQTEAQDVTEQHAPPAVAEAPEDLPTEESEQELLARLELPRPEALEAGDDFASYLRAPLPAALRRRALRRLWSVNPTLAARDGLLDYDEDFAIAESAVETVKSAWKVGQGYAKSLAESDEEAPADSPGPTAPAPQDAPPEGPQTPVLLEDGPEKDAPLMKQAAGPAPENEPLPTGPRMRFHFDDA